MTSNQPPDRLAPREIHDLVYRSCRVLGCDPGSADGMAANILHAEIHRGGGVQAFVGMLAGGAAEITEDSEITEVAGAALTFAKSEVDARRSGSATVRFSRPVPLAVLSRTLWEAGMRGVVTSSVSPGDGGAHLIRVLELRRAEVDEQRQAATERRTMAAFKEGIAVPAPLLATVQATADRFLVAEATLDTIA